MTATTLPPRERAVAAGHAMDSTGQPILLLPERPRRYGPGSRRLLIRLGVVLLAVEGLGAWLLFAVRGARAHAAGLSLVFPGGGFLYVASPLLFIASQVALVVALVLWWGVSTHFSIPLVWLIGVGGAMALADGPRLFVSHGTHWAWAVTVVYVLALLLVGSATVRVERRFRRKRALVPALNEYLREAAVPERMSYERDPDRMDAELLRWCYAFAHQPDDGLVGLDWGEQFHGGTQLRYQLNSLSWAMSLYAANFVPNAPRQIGAALEKVVAKHSDLRVWGYWHTLNLLGNFDPNPDPIRRDNIMFSAFLGDVLNTFEAATGSSTFDQPGSLSFVWKDGRVFEYDHHSITDAVQRNFDRSRLGFFPCEPGWSFTVCNIMGAQALRGHDTAHGTEHWDGTRDRWQQTLEDEYLTPDGSYAHIRSNHVGLSWDTGEVPGGHYFAQGTHRFVDILPEHARRAKALDVRAAKPKMTALSAMVDHGVLELTLPAEPERHHTSASSLLAWNKVIGGARLVNDAVLLEAAIVASARQCSTGERWPGRPVSVGAAGLGAHLLLRWSAPLDLAALNMRGYAAPVGPVLADTDLDAVLVTLARSDDGVRLRLAFEPVDHAVPQLTLRFIQLEPGQRYLLSGGTVLEAVADADGSAAFFVGLVDGPQDLTLEPTK